MQHCILMWQTEHVCESEVDAGVCAGRVGLVGKCG